MGKNAKCGCFSSRSKTLLAVSVALKQRADDVSTGVEVSDRTTKWLRVAILQDLSEAFKMASANNMLSVPGERGEPK